MSARSWLCAAALLHALDAGAADAPDVRVVLALEDQANEIWSALPGAADDQRVLRLGHTPAACADDAMRRAKEAVERGQAGRLALRTLSLDVRLPRSLLKKAGAASAAHVAELFGRYVGSEEVEDFVTRVSGRAPVKDAAGDTALRALYSTMIAARSDHVLQPFLDLSCPGAALYEIRALPDQPGRLFLHMLIESGCACAALSAGSAPRRFRVLGRAELEPGASGYDARGVTLRWRVKAPRYTVLASCAACGEREREDPSAEAAASTGSCVQSCAPMKQAAAGWQGVASAAERDLEALSATVTSLGSATAQHRKDLDTAQAAPRTPAARTAALRGRLEGAQAELGRVTRAAGEARERAEELRRAADEARSADARCEAQCQARQHPAQPEAAAGGAGTGGGVSTTALVLGGAAAAGAAAAVAARSSEPAPPPDPEPVLEGEWAGTALHDIEFQESVCVRALDESWSVRRSGSTYTVAITRRETCNAAFTCPQGCLGRAFSPVTVTGGTVDGNRFTFPAWHDVFFGPKPCPVTGTFDAQRLAASSTGPCTVLVVPEGPVLHQYRMELSRR